MREPALQTLGRDAGDGFAIAAEPRDGDCAIIDVSSENLDFRLWAPDIHGLAKQDRDRERFLSRRAARHPDAHGFMRALAGDETLQNRLFQSLERLGIPKEMSHTDQQFVKQRIEFFRLFAEPFDIFGMGIDMEHLHSALQPANQRFFLVFAEIVAAPSPERAHDHRHVRGRVGA